MTGASLQFATPWILILLPLVGLVGWWIVRRRRNGLPFLRYSDLHAVRPQRQSLRQTLLPMLHILRALVLTAMVVALARPQWVMAREIVRGEGVDIALALDISGSMASLDFEPQNRLEAAQDVIDDFIAARPHDRIGLVVFAEDAFHQSPPTVDHDMLRGLLNETQLAPALGINDGTAIGMGIANAANMLVNSDAKSRVVILLTDGVNNRGSIDPSTAAYAAKTLGIRIYTVGMGKQGMVPVPMVDAFGREQFAMQESAIDEGVLYSIAEATGGKYYRADSRDTLRQIYEEINSLERSDYVVESFTTTRELAAYAMMPALLFFLLEMLLRHSWLRSIP
jgi:Ca-activated chloride channel family protein